MSLESFIRFLKYQYVNRRFPLLLLVFFPFVSLCLGSPVLSFVFSLDTQDEPF